MGFGAGEGPVISRFCFALIMIAFSPRKRVDRDTWSGTLLGNGSRWGFHFVMAFDALLSCPYNVATLRSA
jgi:hypothetical protein